MRNVINAVFGVARITFIFTVLYLQSITYIVNHHALRFNVSGIFHKQIRGNEQGMLQDFYGIGILCVSHPGEATDCIYTEVHLD